MAQWFEFQAFTAVAPVQFPVRELKFQKPRGRAKTANKVLIHATHWMTPTRDQAQVSHTAGGFFTN